MIKLSASQVYGEIKLSFNILRTITWGMWETQRIGSEFKVEEEKIKMEM